MKSLADAAVRDELRERLKRLQPNSSRQWGKMTAHEAVCHLSDSFRVCMGAKAVSSKTGIVERSVMKWAALYLPVPWPKGVPTRPEVEQGVGGTPPGRFAEDRDALAQLIDEFSACQTRSPHPIFGRMKPNQWQRWGYLHTDHHLRQFGV